MQDAHGIDIYFLIQVVEEGNIIGSTLFGENFSLKLNRMNSMMQIIMVGLTTTMSDSDSNSW